MSKELIESLMIGATITALFNALYWSHDAAERAAMRRASIARLRACDYGRATRKEKP